MTIFKKLMFYTLIIYYNLIMGALLLIGFLFKGKQILEVKKHPRPAVFDKYIHKTALINGLNLHYVEAGDPSKPLIVFIHGFPEFWYSWRYQLEEFSKDYWCIALDQRGYSESAKPAGVENYVIPNLTKDIRELIRHLGREKFTLVGHDWGSVIGFQYAMDYMGTLNAYIMMGAPPRDVHRQVAATDKEQFHMMWYIYFFLAPYLPEMVLRALDMAVFDWKMSENVTKEEIEAYKYTFGEEAAFTSPINYYRANITAPLSESKPDHYVNGLFMLGDRDDYISKKCGPLAEKWIPKLKFKLLENTDHFCQQSNPKLVNEEIRKFLNEQNIA